MPPRTFFFAGKAAPAYYLAKVIIKFINNLAQTIDSDPAIRGKLNVVFLPEYNVTLAERCIPAADVSNQISTAGYEASGTSNMKFMMNGALTLGTRDGATIEMAEEAGEENFFLFGLTADEVASSRPWYSPYWHYQNEPETRKALDLIFSDHFSREEPGIFEPLRGALLTHGDQFMHLADLTSYLRADGALCALYRKPDDWAHKVILNIAALGQILQRPHDLGICEARSGARSRVRRKGCNADCRRSGAPVQSILGSRAFRKTVWADDQLVAQRLLRRRREKRAPMTLVHRAAHRDRASMRIDRPPGGGNRRAGRGRRPVSCQGIEDPDRLTQLWPEDWPARSCGRSAFRLPNAERA